MTPSDGRREDGAADERTKLAELQRAVETLARDNAALRADLAALVARPGGALSHPPSAAATEPTAGGAAAVRVAALSPDHSLRGRRRWPGRALRLALVALGFGLGILYVRLVAPAAVQGFRDGWDASRGDPPPATAPAAPGEPATPAAPAAPPP